MYDSAQNSSASTTTVGLDLPVRTACNHCRSKKIKCDKVPVEQGGCSRCTREHIQCSYDIRDPIGRPKKRKTEKGGESQSPAPDSHVKHKRRSKTAKGCSPPRRVGSESSWLETVPTWIQSSPQDLSSAIGSLSATPGTSPIASSTAYNTIRQRDKASNLSDLGLAAFLESLDTLEINPEDGLTPNMLQSLNSDNPMQSAIATPMDSTIYDGLATPSQLSFSSLTSTCFAVPADLSWADSSWLLNAADASRRPVPPPDDNCSCSHKASALVPTPKIKQGPCPKTGAESCCCGETAGTSTSSPRVHCVPNPTGKGCTCLCDVGVALINVRATLRQARDQTFEQEQQQGSAKQAVAASTLQLTLSASQAVADQCACSASCPTCRSDPSTSLSASLLVSTALQIYIRAVRTLRQGFGAAQDRDEQRIEGEWDVSIGQYKPKPNNAKKIALFAMKLELKDLRDAIGKISTAASATAASERKEEHSSIDEIALRANDYESMNPIDQVVIRKLHLQICDLLKTVEGIE
ncbi:hypothetical protein CBS101457_000506 [Exobasidium rhododendri]|nr:hypothetical protein CBS101457_000506 [Exobasidium rhododendri]